MMNDNLIVLLVTTPPNAVCQCLQTCVDITLHVVDVTASYADAGKRIEKAVAEVNPDVLLTYRCPCVLSERCFSIPRFGAYNIHPSRLPFYRGLNPWTDIFANGERTNGVTLHKITAEVDAGEVVFQVEYNIEPCDTVSVARKKADVLAAELARRLVECLLPKSTASPAPTQH